MGLVEDKETLLNVLQNELDTGSRGQADMAKARIDIAVAEAQLRAATAAERSTRFMLWATVAAAVSAIGTFAAALVAVIGLLAHKLT
jgi:hypothetical protein